MKKHLGEHLYNPNFWYDPKNPKSECILQVSGITFDPDAFLSKSNFSEGKEIISGIIGIPDDICEKIKNKELHGDAKKFVENGNLSKEEFFDAFKIFETPFLLIRISKATTFDLQLEEALLFLRNHSENLRNLCNYPNVEDVSMSFFAQNYDDSECKDFPDEFYDLVEQIGIGAIMC
jgi:hypothetical protein